MYISGRYDPIMTRIKEQLVLCILHAQQQFISHGVACKKRDLPNLVDPAHKS
jgi:hypothetical protein